ncbi:MAG: amino acid permease [Christensenellales bacterium]|nr:amino acid permease [Christensenellales bacterium]
MNAIQQPGQDKKIKWYMLALMSFSTVWGFDNLINGFMYFNGIQAIFSWILMFALYFVPYALMVGELGSAFKDSSGGVSSWVQGTFNKRVAYYAGWTYWAVHVTYVASKGSRGLKALSWAVFRNATVFDTQLPIVSIQLATLILFLLFCFIASRGVKALKNISSLAGMTMFTMSILFILMMFAAPAVNPNGGYITTDFSLKNLLPNFNLNYFASMSILVFAVGGCEKMSPYVNKVDKPSKNFPRSMIALAIMVMFCAILGTIAMSMMFDPSEVGVDEATRSSYIANGAYLAFQKVGNYYGVGDTLMVIYAVCNTICQFSSLLISIDAPLRMLLGNESTQEFIPSAMLKQNKHGSYINGIRLVAVLAGTIILAQMVVPGAADAIAQLIKLSSVCMPLRYLWVFVAYIGLRKHIKQIPTDYRFVKNQKLAFFFGYWCFGVTAICCIMGMYSSDTFTMILNVATPCLLVALGMIMPWLAKRERLRKQV